MKPVETQTTIREIGIYCLKPRLNKPIIPATHRPLAQGEERGAKRLTRRKSQYVLLKLY